MPKPGASTPPEIREILDEIPAPKDMVDLAWKELGIGKMSAEIIEKNFPQILNALSDAVYEFLKRYQSVAEDKITELAREMEKKDPKRAQDLIRAGHTSLGNQRKKRAGVVMERVLGELLAFLGISNESGKPITGRSDLVIPSISLFESKPERAIIVECKRTIRERWKELRDEVSSSGHNVWFVTFDDQLTEDVVYKITTGGVVLFLLPEVYENWKLLVNCPTCGKALEPPKIRKGVRSIMDLVDDLRFFVEGNEAVARKAEPVLPDIRT